MRLNFKIKSFKCREFKKNYINWKKDIQKIDIFKFTKNYDFAILFISFIPIIQNSQETNLKDAHRLFVKLE